MSIIRFERRTVQFTENISVDGYQMPDGEFRVGLAGASKALGFADNWLSRTLTKKRIRTLEALQKEGFTGKIKTGVVKREERGATSVDTISCKDFLCLVRYAATQGSVFAMQILGIKSCDNRKHIPKKTEKGIQEKLSNRLNGRMEVPCPAGIMDIVTDSEVIEIKQINAWKSAVGQVLIYKSYHPNLLARIHLFGKYTPDARSLIEKHCLEYHINVTFEE